MEVKIEEAQPATIPIGPLVPMIADDGDIVLANEGVGKNGTFPGIVIRNRSLLHKVGYYSPIWAAEKFKPFFGKIIISQ